MLRRTRSAALALGLLMFLSRPGAGAPGPGSETKLRVLVLEGTPYRMGVIHGTALRPEITELIERWKADLASTYKVPAEEYIRRFLSRTNFRPAIDRWTPGLLEEVRGIADGAGIDFDTMFAFQLIDESWVMGEDLGFGKCTTVAAGKRGDHPAFTAQTLDVPRFYHGFPTMLRIRGTGEDPEALVFTIPGVIAANGLNSRSVGVCVNAVPQLAHSAEGLPVAFVVRGILRRRTYEQAVKFLRDIEPAAPQNYALAGMREAGSFERSAGKMVPFLPFKGAEFAYHTNHPLANDELDPGFMASLKRDGISLEIYRTFCPRLDFLKRTLSDNSKTIDLTLLKTIFADRASGINNAETYVCTIMILGEKPELHVAPGRPDIEPFQVLAFSPL